MTMSQRQTASRRKGLQVVMGPDQHLHIGCGGHIRVQVVSAHFAALVVDDLCRIRHAPEGEALLAACDALGHPVIIAPLETPIDPPNATIEPTDRRAATAAGRATGQVSATGEPVLGLGTGCGSRICYDPAEWPWSGDPACPSGARVLRALLRQAWVNARGADDPTDGETCLAHGEA